MWGLFLIGCYVQATQGNVTRDQLGIQGGYDHFRRPLADLLAQVQGGKSPTTEHSAVETLEYRI